MKRSDTTKPVDKVNIHEGHRQRLKESVLHDPEMQSLSDFEVLEYILTFVIPRKDTNPIAHNLISKFGSLYYVFTAPYTELSEIPDITQNAAHLLSNLFALVRRIYQSKGKKTLYVQSVKDSAVVLAPFFALRDTERVYIMFLDVHERVIGVDLIASGEAARSDLDISLLVKNALKYKAVAAILSHNHPGGDWRPSNSDILATKRICNALECVGTYLADHIIFTDDGFFSFFQAGLLVHSPLDCQMDSAHCRYEEIPRYAYKYYFAEGEL